MGYYPVPISVSRGHFALRYEVPKFLPRGGHLCMAMLTIAATIAAASEQLLGPYMYEEISEWLQGGSCSQDLHA